MPTTGSSSSSRACSRPRERPERCHFEHAEERIPGHRRHGRRLHRRRLAETGGDAQVAGREIRERERSTFLRALSDQALAEPDDGRAGRQLPPGRMSQRAAARKGPRRARRIRPRRRRASAPGPTGGAGRTRSAMRRPAGFPSRVTRSPSPSAVRPSPAAPCLRTSTERASPPVSSVARVNGTSLSYSPAAIALTEASRA